MTLQVVPGWLGQSGIQHPAKLYRNMLAAIAGRRTGFFRYGDFTLTPSGSAMSLTIGRGDAYLHGTETATDQGGYYAWNNANEVLAWPAAPASNPRIDSLILRVIDTDYGADAAGSKATWEIVQGTPAASPVAVADSAFAPAGAYYHPGAWVRVADFTVANGSTNLAAATMAQTLRYVRQGRGQIVGTYGIEPADPQRGDIIQYNAGSHAGQLFNYSGSAWLPAGWGAWTAYTPTVVNNAISGTQATQAKTVNHAQYKRVGDIVFYDIDVTITNAVTNGVAVTLPFVAAERWQNCGSAALVGSGSPTTQSGLAYMVVSNAAVYDRIVCTDYAPAYLNAPAGAVFRAHGYYKVLMTT